MRGAIVRFTLLAMIAGCGKTSGATKRAAPDAGVDARVTAPFAGIDVGVSRVCATTPPSFPKWQFGAVDPVTPLGQHRSRLYKLEQHAMKSQNTFDLAANGTASLDTWYEDERGVGVSLKPWAGTMKWTGTWHTVAGCTTVVLDPTSGPATKLVLACADMLVETETKKSSRVFMCVADEPAIYTFPAGAPERAWMLFGEPVMYREPTVGYVVIVDGSRRLSAADP